jgi:hypothetical protein
MLVHVLHTSQQGINSDIYVYMQAQFYNSIIQSDFSHPCIQEPTLLSNNKKCMIRVYPQPHFIHKIQDTIKRLPGNTHSMDNHISAHH